MASASAEEMCDNAGPGQSFLKAAPWLHLTSERVLVGLLTPPPPQWVSSPGLVLEHVPRLSWSTSLGTASECPCDAVPKKPL